MCKKLSLAEVILIQDLVSIVSKQFKNPAIFERCRTQEYTVPRHLVHYILVEVLEYTHSQVTLISGYKKTAQINSIKFIDSELQMSGNFRSVFIQVITKAIDRLSSERVLRQKYARKDWFERKLYNHYIESFENYKLPHLIRHEKFLA